MIARGGGQPGYGKQLGLATSKGLGLKGFGVTGAGRSVRRRGTAAAGWCNHVVCFGVAAIVLAALVLLGPGIEAFSKPANDALSRLEVDIAGAHRGLPEITTQQLEHRISRGAPGVVLLDARMDEEFKVSRLPGALRVDPDAGAEDILALFRDKVRGRDVVVYCSVGVRSSKLAERVTSVLKAQGARSVASLRGGIFRWHNDRRQLRDEAGPVDIVHPYSWQWEKFLSRSGQISYLPRSK